MKERNFFFDPDPSAESEETESSGLTNEEHAETFFNTLKEAGIVQDMPIDSFEEKQFEVEGYKKEVKNSLLSIEYGVYQKDYSVHITPLNERRNLTDQTKFKLAFNELCTILNEYVPTTSKVDLFLPRNDWNMKVITAVVRGGATAWNFDYDALEKDGIPKMLERITKVIMS